MTIFLTHRNPDGSEVPRDEEHEGIRRLVPEATPLLVDRYVDDLTALQLGLARMLLALQPVSIDRQALVTKGAVEARAFELKRAFLDWPDTEDDLIPVASVTVMAPDEQDLELKGPLTGQQMLEGTIDKFAPGTQLRELYELQTRMDAVFILGEKDERSAVRKAIIDAFGGEPGDERVGRRTIVPEYFDRVGRYFLKGITYDDAPDTARGKRWPLVARFDADIQVVQLVATAAEIRPRFGVTT